MTCAVLMGAPVHADPVSGRVLGGLEIRSRGEITELHVRFRIPMRYVRHSPQTTSRQIVIQVDPVRLPRTDPGATLGREAMKPPPDAPVSVVEVTYEGDRAEGPVVEVRLSRRVRFDVAQGADLRSLVISLEEPRRARPHAPRALPTPVLAPEPEPPPSRQPVGPALPEVPESVVAINLSHPFAVQLRAQPADEPLAPLPERPEFDRYRLYHVSFRKDGASWRRLRLGFFETEAEAMAVRDDLRAAFPGAFVVRTESEERLASRSERVVPRATRLEVAREAPRARDAAPGTPAPSGGIEGLIREGRDALTTGDTDRAVALFTKATSLPENDRSPEARELLGLARERNGQFAHAQAEYEEFLRRYPGHESATRVRQRLDSMMTARAAPSERLREARSDGRGVDWNGSLSSFYRREARLGDGGRVTSSYIFTDLFLAARGETSRLDVRSEFSGTYRYDLGGSDGDERVYSLFVDLEDRKGPLSGTLGRQSNSSGSFVGRFDGGRVSYRIDDRFKVSALGGFPIDIFLSNSLDTDKYFYGVTLDAEGLAEGLDFQLFALRQQVDGITDRTGIGGEFRYFRDDKFLAGFVDYDLHFSSLNTAFLLGNWQVNLLTNVNLFLDYRRLPLLSSTNALIGQPVDSVDDLQDVFSENEIASLAADRSARSKVGTIGVTRRLTDRFQLAGDFTVSELTATDASGGVVGFEGTGLEYTYFAQLIGTDLLLQGDTTLAGLRYFDGNRIRSWALVFDERFPLNGSIRLNPRLTLELRKPEDGADFFTVRPALRIDYRWRRFTIDVEGGLEWADDDRFLPGVESQLGYTLHFGIRYDF